MRFTLPVIWWFYGDTCAGRLELDRDRLTVTSRARTFSFPLCDVESFVVRRGPADRLRGLPVLALRLDTGDELAVASLGGIGSLHDLVAALAGAQPVASGT